MSLDLTVAPFPVRFEHLLRVISSERFLKMESLGKEVPFFICPYDPHDAVEMQRLVGQLARRLQQGGVSVIQIDLYDLAVELLRDRGIWEQVLEIEPSVSKGELLGLPTTARGRFSAAWVVSAI